MDAAVEWAGNGRMYFFKGEDYWRYNYYRRTVDYGYPKKISKAWLDVPNMMKGYVIISNLFGHRLEIKALERSVKYIISSYLTTTITAREVILVSALTAYNFKSKKCYAGY